MRDDGGFWDCAIFSSIRDGPMTSSTLTVHEEIQQRRGMTDDHNSRELDVIESDRIAHGVRPSKISGS